MPIRDPTRRHDSWYQRPGFPRLQSPSCLAERSSLAQGGLNRTGNPRRPGDDIPWRHRRRLGQRQAEGWPFGGCGVGRCVQHVSGSGRLSVYALVVGWFRWVWWWLCWLGGWWLVFRGCRVRRGWGVLLAGDPVGWSGVVFCVAYGDPNVVVTRPASAKLGKAVVLPPVSGGARRWIGARGWGGPGSVGVCRSRLRRRGVDGRRAPGMRGPAGPTGWAGCPVRCGFVVHHEPEAMGRRRTAKPTSSGCPGPSQHCVHDDPDGLEPVLRQQGQYTSND